MNNEFKMKFKSIPGLSAFAVMVNREIVRPIRLALRHPLAHKDNKALLKMLNGLQGAERPRVWYFGVPTHNNLGDQAQKFCILAWVEANCPGAEVVKISSRDFNGGAARTAVLLKRLVRPDDVIIMQSGHTMDGLHPDETAHRMIPDSFPGNRIVFFPTSIKFLSKRGMRRDIRAINAHPRTLFLARDAVSAEKARSIYPKVDVRLYPDVVTTLIGKYEFDGHRSGALLCTRNDGEKFYSYGEIDALADELERQIGSLAQTDTTVDLGGIDLDSKEAWSRIEKVIESYAHYRVVVTDRYHGTIFARIAGTPVVVLRTADHKVTSGAQWFEDAGDEAITVAGDLASVPDLARGLMTRFPEGAAAPPFAAPYYEELHDLIEAV